MSDLLKQIKEDLEKHKCRASVLPDAHSIHIRIGSCAWVNVFDYQIGQGKPLSIEITSDGPCNYAASDEDDAAMYPYAKESKELIKVLNVIQPYLEKHGE